MTTEYKKPLPAIEEDSKGFWEGCKRHELLIRKCRNCGALRFFPFNVCPNCGSFDSDWVKLSGKGKVYSYMVVNRQFHPAFEVPYNVVQVELDEGAQSLLPVRLNSNLLGVKPEELCVGMPVEVVFEDVTPEITLPKFRRVS